jgi:hypothetical protein
MFSGVAGLDDVPPNSVAVSQRMSPNPTKPACAPLRLGYRRPYAEEV